MGKHTYATTADPTSAATTHIAFVGDHLYGSSVEVLEVIVEQVGAADADFNVEVDGNDLFGSEQSVSSAGTPEKLQPEQNDHAAGEWVELAVDVSSAGTGTDLNVSVVIDDGKDD